jgi:hypothetical protein
MVKNSNFVSLLVANIKDSFIAFTQKLLSNILKVFSSSPTILQNKVECLSLETFLKLAGWALKNSHGQTTFLSRARGSG